MADKAANVDISKVHGGYFSDRKNLDVFVKLGIDPIKNNFPKSLDYVDFGGGQGHLASYVKKYLEENRFTVKTTVADANNGYLELSKQKGLETKLCNLESASFIDIDLISMRAVLHYNTPVNQTAILKNVFNSLKKGGYFVHQNSSGNKENCELRSALVNIKELGRAGAGHYHWVSEDEHKEMLKNVGFIDIVQAGYASPNAWGPVEQWERFNSDKTKKAVEVCDIKLFSELETRKKVYLDKAYALIKEYCDKYGKEYLGVKENSRGEVVIEYLYPIIISRK